MSHDWRISDPQLKYKGLEIRRSNCLLFINGLLVNPAQLGEIIHQHQTHIGMYGSERIFPEEWLMFPTIK